MDNTRNCLPSIGQLPQKSNDVISRLTIQARGGFVNEEQQRRFTCRLYSNGNTFSLLIIETSTNSSNCGSGNISHFQQINDSFDIFVLICCTSRLAASNCAGNCARLILRTDIWSLRHKHRCNALDFKIVNSLERRASKPFCTRLIQ